jgi:type IV secretory pathway TrbF-like protein
MLEHQKFVLKSISDQEHLFRKELLKSFEWLSDEELYELFNWLKDNAYFSHKDCVKQAFHHSYIKVGA